MRVLLETIRSRVGPDWLIAFLKLFPFAGISTKPVGIPEVEREASRGPGDDQKEGPSQSAEVTDVP
jgi:hypothetical protein